jgi:hypothetical protein
MSPLAAVVIVLAVILVLITFVAWWRGNRPPDNSDWPTEREGADQLYGGVDRPAGPDAEPTGPGA